MSRPSAKRSAPIRRILSVSLVLAAVFAIAPTPASAGPADDATLTFRRSSNMRPVGFSERTATARFNSDLAFWGDRAYQGHYDGFRILDVSDPANPVGLVNYTQCAGDQGDLLIWENLLIRSWNSPASSTQTCGGQLVGSGFEGLHLFDVSNPASPVLLRAIRMASNTTPTGCGSHTATLVPDIDRGNLYVYNSASSGSCPGIDIVRIPLANPADAVFVRREPSGRSCHDTGAILGEANLVACAGGNGFTVWSVDPSIAPPAPGSLEDPIQLYTVTVSGVSIGHSAAFTWDGEVLIFGHEPGGGSQAQCQATSSTVNRSIFFYRARTGQPLGSFLLPRPQGPTENCTWHNYDIVPSWDKYLLVAGNYQAGISVVDFSDPANAQEIAFADPLPLVPPTQLGGDWSSYWYDGLIYESDITRGLIIWELNDPAVVLTKGLGHLNPQTQELTIPIDREPPVTTAKLTPGPVNGWHVDPTVTLTADDGDGSGVASTEFRLDAGDWQTYTDPFQVTGDGDHSLEFRSEDRLGHIEDTRKLEFRVDGTAPTIDLRAPVDGEVFIRDSVADADYACEDARSGIARCEGTVDSGTPIPTGTVGFRSFVVEAEDVAGNTASTEAVYQVIYDFDGFFPPVDPSPTLNVMRAGSAVPLKFSLGGFYGLDVVTSVTSAPIACSSAPRDEVEAPTAASESSLTFEDGEYAYVWKTNKAWAGTCREVAVSLDDGTDHTARFQFRL